MARVPFWRNLRLIRIAAQLVAVAVAGFLLYILWFNLSNNLRRLGIRTDFEFLDQPFGVRIAGSDLRPGSSVREGLFNGIRNTLALAVVGLPVLTIIGVLVGVGKLSSNWLVAKVSSLFVETIRNLPPLLLILFAFQAVILRLPPARSPLTPFGWLVVSNLQIYVPGFASGSRASTFQLVMLVTVLAGAGLWWWRTRVEEKTGQPHHRWVWTFGLVLVVGVATYLILDRPITISLPTLEGRVITGGFGGLGGFFAVLGALVLYTSSHVAEIVRGSIQAVSKGQTEAANALALSNTQRLRFVVFPQAFRIALPPTINQYLNYVKNTSLAIAVGFADVTLIAYQAIGNGQPAPQTVLILMGCYLMFSLAISAVVNAYSRRFRLVTR